MAREVDERFESAAALAEALRQVASELHLGEAATVMMPSVLPPSLAAGPASELESAATVAATQPARSVEACRADTEAPISVTARRAIRGRPWALAAGGVALVAIVAFAWSALRAGSAPAAEAAVAPGSGSPSAAAAARVAPTDEAAATAVAPSASATDAGPGAPPSAGFRAGPTPKPKPAATKPSRDQRHQMATDNPF
jgi:hypothetical protein